MSITTRRFFATIAGVLLLVLGLQTWELATSYRSAVELAENRAVLRSRANANLVAGLIKQVDIVLLDLRDHLDGDGAMRQDPGRIATLDHLVHRHLAPLPATIDVHVSDAQGRIIASSVTPLPATEAIVPPRLREPGATADDHLILSELQPDGPHPLGGIILSRPISHERGRHAGMVLATLHADALGSVMMGRGESGRQWATALIDAQQHIVLRRPPRSDGILGWLDDPHLADPAFEHHTFSGTLPGDAEDRCWSLLRIGTFPLYSLAGHSRALALEGWWLNLVVNLVAMLGIITGLGVSAWLLRRTLLAAQREHATEQRFRELYNKTPAMMVSFDGQGCITAVSDAMLSHFGYDRDQVLGRQATAFMTPEYRTLAIQERLPLFFSIGWVRDSHYQFLNHTGEVLDILLSAIANREPSGAVSVIATMTDVTARMRAESELRQSQEQLVQVQKMDAIGRLAGGMAHDFNNMLTVMVGYGSLLQRRFPPGSVEGEYTEGILQSASKAAALTRQLLVFSRKQVEAPTVLDLNAVVAELQPMLRRLVREDIELVVTPGRNLWPVRADAGQIGQVVMNLVVNARDAMPHGGCLSITLGNRTVPVSQSAPKPPPGTWVQITVSDTGSGMSNDVLSHLFEPFFTTKAAGAGTGLGLSIIYGIVTQGGGHVTVTSVPGQGSIFTVSLPACTEPTAPAATGPSQATPTLAKGCRILVVEDETEVLNALRLLLGAHGFSVICAGDGQEALALFDGRSRPCDIVLTDVIMPRLGGRELAMRLQTRHPDLPVIFMSGYTGDSGAPQDLAGRNRHFLAKPFTNETLLLAIRDALAVSG